MNCAHKSYGVHKYLTNESLWNAKLFFILFLLRHICVANKAPNRVAITLTIQCWYACAVIIITSVRRWERRARKTSRVYSPCRYRFKIEHKTINCVQFSVVFENFTVKTQNGRWNSWTTFDRNVFYVTLMLIIEKSPRRF